MVDRISKVDVIGEVCCVVVELAKLASCLGAALTQFRMTRALSIYPQMRADICRAAGNKNQCKRLIVKLDS